MSTRDYKRPLAAPKARPRAPLPAWAMLSAGVLLGLFIAFLAYLAGLPAEEEMPRLSLPRLDTGSILPAPQADADQPDRTAQQPPPKPRFEFYSILPELEVIVPEPEPRDPPGEDTDQAPGPAPAEVEGGEAYFLQAGSFRSTAEADRMKANLTLLGLEVVVQSVSVNGTRWHRVRVGPYRDSRSLNQARRRLHENRIEYMTLKASTPG